jgi:hypothetical protein
LGVLWGNPTFYLEWNARSDEPDHVEGKLLLGDQIAGGWHWGTNLVFEHEMGGEQTDAYELTAGLGRTVHDGKFSVGGEVKLALEDVAADRGNYTRELLVGPSVQLHPLPQTRLDLVALTGIGDESPRSKFILTSAGNLEKRRPTSPPSSRHRRSLRRFRSPERRAAALAHSERSATIGSTRDARRAGSQQASSETAPRKSGAATKTAGSMPLTR